MNIPNCKKCQSVYVYQDENLFICPECTYEWQEEEAQSNELEVLDANGTKLATGDNITIIKDLKLKGGAGNLKIGTKIKNITLIEGDHNISCRTSQFGAIYLKSEFVKKTS